MEVHYKLKGGHNIPSLSFFRMRPVTILLFVIKGLILIDKLSQGAKLNRPRGLEFIYPLKEIMVSTNTELLPITLILSSFGSSAAFKPTLDDISNMITKVKNMPGLKDQANLIGITRVLEETLLQISDISQYIDLINDYSNPAMPTHATHPCNLTFAGGFSLAKTQELRLELNSLQLGIDLEWQSEKLTRPLEGGAAILSYAFDSRDSVHRFKENLVNHVIQLDALSRGEIPDDVPALMQNLDCYHTARHESVKLTGCTKIATGLACDFEVEIYSTMQAYLKMQPINYGSAELKIKPNLGFIAKSINSNELGLLNCTSQEDDDIHSCTYFTWDNPCSKALTGTDYLQTVKACNFTINPPADMRVLDGGVLVQNPKTVVKIDGKFPNARTIDSKVPIVVFSKDPIELTINREGTRFSPELSDNEYEIITTLLTTEVIEKMRAKAEINPDDLWELMEIITYSLMSVHTLLIPLSIYSCVVLCRRRTNGSHPSNRPGLGFPLQMYSHDRRGNYHANKSLMRQAREEFRPSCPASL